MNNNDSEYSESSIALERAWKKFSTSVETIRQAFLASPLMALTPDAVDSAYRCLTQAQAHAHNLMIGPDPDHPVFLFNTLFDPFIYGWLAPVPDFFYRMAFVNGNGVYRIRVKANDATWINFHVRSDMWGMDDVNYLGSFDLEQFSADEHGWYEIIVSAERQPGNWIPIQADSTYNFFNVRATLLDWANGIPPEFHIEVVQAPKQPAGRGSLTIARRIERAAMFMEYSVLAYTIKVNEDILKNTGDVNQFATHSGAVFKNAGNSPRNLYTTAVFDVGLDEALIVDIEPPQDARYWGILLADIFGQTLNYTEHQSCLNARQSILDKDGRARFVIAARDPGIPNWLDTGGRRVGVVQLRAHGAKEGISPITTKVRLEEVRSHLPENTPAIDADERQQVISHRGQSIRRLYGY